MAHRRPIHGDVQLHVHLPLHRLEPHRAAERGRLQGGDRHARGQGRQGWCEARRPRLHRHAVLARADGARRHDRRPDRRRARLRCAGEGDRRYRHRRRRRADGGARAPRGQGGRRGEAADPLRAGRDEVPRHRGRARRPVARRRGRPGAARRADRPGQHLPSVSSRLALAKAAKSRFDAFGIRWDDTSGTRNGHFAPFAWSS